MAETRQMVAVSQQTHRLSPYTNRNKPDISSTAVDGECPAGGVMIKGLYMTI